MINMLENFGEFNALAEEFKYFGTGGRGAGALLTSTEADIDSTTRANLDRIMGDGTLKLIELRSLGWQLLFALQGIPALINQLTDNKPHLLYQISIDETKAIIENMERFVASDQFSGGF